MMLEKMRNPLPGIENASEAVRKAAMSAAQAAKDATCQVEDWAKAGYGSARDVVTTKPLVVGAASLGLGAIMGGLYSLWQRGAAKARPARKAMPVRARAKQSLRATAPTNGAGSATKRKPKRTRRAPKVPNA